MTTSSKRKSKKPQSAFRIAEAISHDQALKGQASGVEESGIEGLLQPGEVRQKIKELRKLDVDTYIQRVVGPSENQKRPSAPEVIRQLGGKLVSEENDGPFYSAELEFEFSGQKRRLGFIAQNHKSQNGVWQPQHHHRAAETARFFASHGMPLVTFMDTPGAAADAEANLNNQAHRISFFISEMANIQVPVVGIVYGCGYSGGAIPLATANVLLSTREGVFNTIHPKGLANIARKYNLSWQESAKYIGVSSYELLEQGYFDGIVDFSFEASHQIVNLKSAIISAIEETEWQARAFLREHDFFFEHYRESINHYLNPSELLIEANRKTDRSPTGTLNVFGDVYRFMRTLKLRRRITSRSVHQYSRLSHRQTPVGRLQERLKQERMEKFQRWLEAPLEIRYDELLQKRFQAYRSAREDRNKERGRFVAFFMGDPKENFQKALEELTSEVLLHLYNLWKDSSIENLTALRDHLQGQEWRDAPENPDLLQVILEPEVCQHLLANIPSIILFDLLYDRLIEGLPSIAGELKGSNLISQESVERLFEEAFEGAMKEVQARDLRVDSEQARERFFQWLARFIAQKNVDDVMATISAWKRIVFPRMSPPLFGLVRYYFSGLLPSLYEAQRGTGKFNGKITPRNIGIKDFWNRLDQAYKDLLIQNQLREYKRHTISAKEVVDRFFNDFQELDSDRITANPLQFPGFRDAIEKALDNHIQPCGVITGIAQFQARLQDDSGKRFKVGLVVSNTEFQAGAFDMASCEKVCRLLDECARLHLPLILFVSSAGMQTKEGAGSLFSMAIVNDRITRFVKDFDLPVICFGFRDCTGGAQASFVTHLLARTYYLSGAQIPFAGQLVVESHLPAQATLSNYLSRNEEAMDGLVVNPFDAEIDQKLRAIDPDIPVPQATVEEVLSRVLSGEYQLRIGEHEDLPEENLTLEALNTEKIQRVLIHARGCTAARLIKGAQESGRQVVLVASDPDMESHPAQMLGPNDRLVCIGGNTPQESYLNAMSVIRVAEQEEADAVHPGIGFLSESPRYARICREHGFNFIGPRASNMDLMGNKSNAIATAKSLNIPVVPGSEGALTDPVMALAVAEEIGFPVLIKATHGGGGKGISVVEESAPFVSAFTRMSQEARSAFGSGDLYLEKFIGSMRHLEVQVLRDLHGNAHLLGIRDCSVQRNYQKLVEESAFDLPEKIRQELVQHSSKLVQDMDYVGAGTVEFIFDLTEQTIYFMEMNTRLQVEHPVTEMTSGVDLVMQQFAVAEGASLKDLKPRDDGHAIELRINAERIEIGDRRQLRFVPSPGVISEMRLPDEDHIRVLAAVNAGSTVTPYYDSLIAQIISWGKNRQEAIERLVAYLGRVQIHGVPTNLTLSRRILEDELFRKGDFDTKFLDGFLKRIDQDLLIQETKDAAGDAGMELDLEALQLDRGELKVLSPQMGGFYRASTPEAEPLVQEGQVIDVHRPLCLMESMKVFTELSLSSFQRPDGAPLYPVQRYRLNRVIAEDRQTVNQGDLLFVLEPLGPVD